MRLHLTIFFSLSAHFQVNQDEVNLFFKYQANGKIILKIILYKVIQLKYIFQVSPGQLFHGHLAGLT